MAEPGQDPAGSAHAPAGSFGGLSTSEARSRYKTYGPNRLRPPRRSSALVLFLSQFSSPIILILIFAAGLSLFLRDRMDAAILLTIILLSGGLGYVQERGAVKAVDRLRAQVRVKGAVIRDGREEELPIEEIVPGDVIRLRAGDMIPADGPVLEARDLFVDEAALTGETFPAEKRPGPLPAAAPLAHRPETLFLGTHVVSGTGFMSAERTGRTTELGKISERLGARPAKTEFERGVRRFGAFLLEVTLLLVFAIFAVNVYFARPVLDSFLFALALAVGLTPQLLPAIIEVNLAAGAKRMARDRVIVKRLASLENFGSMDVLCADKTGTLTEGRVAVEAVLDHRGAESPKALRLAVLNSAFESGFRNPIDEALRGLAKDGLAEARKLDEIPFDFLRKRISLLVETGEGRLLITKGAVAGVLGICDRAESADGGIAGLTETRGAIESLEAGFNRRGFRTIAVAYREAGGQTVIAREDETGMIFAGLIALADPMKPDIAEVIDGLRSRGVAFKTVTGDSALVAAEVYRRVCGSDPAVVTGAGIGRASDAALVRLAGRTDVFAEVEPNQKERVILALRKGGHVVGFLGDGINDAPALRAADVGISVDSAVDVAKEAADIVLLERGLDILLKGVESGRRTFANTLKYVWMAASANFGNMFSMAAASLVLPFLPLLPKQILLTNLLTDLPEMGIASDRVDPEIVERPRRWDVSAIRRFMLTFGPLSSLFDGLTFAILIFVFRADPARFRAGWFVESVVSAACVVLVVRTRRPAYRSLPSRTLALLTLAVTAAAAALPYTPLARLFGFLPLPIGYWPVLAAIVAAYVLSAEGLKRIYYSRTSAARQGPPPARRRRDQRS